MMESPYGVVLQIHIRHCEFSLRSGLSELSVTCENLCNKQDADCLSFIFFLIKIVRGMQLRIGLLVRKQQPSILLLLWGLYF